MVTVTLLKKEIDYTKSPHLTIFLVSKTGRRKPLLWPLSFPLTHTFIHTIDVLPTPQDKTWHCKILTFKVPMGFGSMVSSISHFLSLAFSLLQSPAGGGGGGEGWGVWSLRVCPNPCSCLSSVHKGSVIIDFLLSFPITNGLTVGSPLRGRPCHNLCSYSWLSPASLTLLSLAVEPIRSCAHKVKTHF